MSTDGQWVTFETPNGRKMRGKLVTVDLSSVTPVDTAAPRRRFGVMAKTMLLAVLGAGAIGAALVAAPWEHLSTRTTLHAIGTPMEWESATSAVAAAPTTSTTPIVATPIFSIVGASCTSDQLDKLGYDESSPHGDTGWQGTIYCQAGDRLTGNANAGNAWTWQQIDTPRITAAHWDHCDLPHLYAVAKTTDNLALICVPRGDSMTMTWEYMSGENPNAGTLHA